MTSESIMAFGKHKGKPLSEIPHSWFEYMYYRHLLTGELKKYAEENVGIIRFQLDKVKT